MQPVLLIHGMWSTSDTLKELGALFSQRQYKVHAPSLPGHLQIDHMGPEEQNALRAQSLSDYVDAMVDYVQTLEQPPVLVGHSMGGLIAQLVAQKVECRALITISSAPPAGINGWSWSVVKTFGHNLLKFPLWKKLTELKLSNIAYGIANTQTSEVHSKIMNESTFESGKASFEIGMWFLYSSPPSKVESDKINCPVLVIGGTEDKITPIKVQQRIARLHGPKCTLQVLPGACHWTIADEHLKATEKCIFPWLNGLNLKGVMA